VSTSAYVIILIFRPFVSLFPSFVRVSGLSPQVEYFAEVYPKRDGITTLFITGTCHEGWWDSQLGIKIGEYMQMKAEVAGRNDLKFIGHIESDIEFQAERGKALMKLMHPGGGSSYATSYKPQKIVESFTGGEKPNILVIGHYHKMSYSLWRNVHCIQAGCTQDQTPFMRKLGLSAHVGGVILSFTQTPDGAIHDISVKFITAFDEAYYKGKGYYIYKDAE